MLVGLAAQIQENPLAHVGERVALDIIEDRTGQKRDDEDDCDGVQLRRIAASQNGVAPTIAGSK